MWLSDVHFRRKVQERIKQSPDWSEVLSFTLVVDAKLSKLDAGERDAIVLVEELSADRLIVDATN